MKKIAANTLNISVLLAIVSLSLWGIQTHLAERYQQRLVQLAARDKPSSSPMNTSSTGLQTLLDSLKIKGSVIPDGNTAHQYNIQLPNEPIAFSKINILFHELHKRQYKIIVCKVINENLQGSVYVQELIISH